MAAPGSTTVLPCSCTNAFQDARYGAGQRVHNLMGRGAQGGHATQARCTCGVERALAKRAA